MKTELTITITSLLWEDKHGYINGPMLPMLFAREMACQLEFKFNRLARVTFSEKKVLQLDQGKDGLTAHDILLIGRQYVDDWWISLWVDDGISGVLVAYAYQTRPVAVLTPVYDETNYLRKLTTDEIQQCFQTVFANVDCLAVKPYQVRPR